MKDPSAYRPKPRARVGDIVRVLSATLLFVVLASLRRLTGLRRRPGWSFGLEVVIAAYRGSWSVMPKIGVVRWRNVGDAMSPLRTDGLEPRFVRQGNGAGEIEG